MLFVSCNKIFFLVVAPHFPALVMHYKLVVSAQRQKVHVGIGIVACTLVALDECHIFNTWRDQLSAGFLQIISLHFVRHPFLFFHTSLYFDAFPIASISP